MTFDPIRDLWKHLRGADSLGGHIDDFQEELALSKAVFKKQIPIEHTFSEIPILVIDHYTEGPKVFGSFSSNSSLIYIPIRFLADTSQKGDARLSASAIAVRDFLHTPVPLETGLVIDQDVSLPEETPTTSPHLEGLRIVVTMMTEEASNG